MENIKVIFWGLGAMGKEMAKLVLKKQGIEIVGAIDKDTTKIGMDLGEFLNEKNIGIKISNDEITMMKKIDADIVILAIDSFVKAVFPAIKTIIEGGKNCITIAEEMAYPFEGEKELAREMDDLARKNNVTILGTGVNPGFVLDSLIITLSAVCKSVKSIKAARINDLSPFGATVMKTQGVGTTLEEFEKGINNGSIVGHIGFIQSINMIANSIGLQYDKIVESREPIISNTYRETPYAIVEPGMVAGCNHIAIAYKGEKEVIVLEHPQQIHPESESIDTGDYIDIYGENDIHLTIKPETPGGIGTVAMAINMIPQVISSNSGLKTMIDFPMPHAIENSFIDQINYYKSK